MRKAEREKKANEIRAQIVRVTIDLPIETFLLLAVEIAMDRPHNQEVIARLKGKDVK